VGQARVLPTPISSLKNVIVHSPTLQFLKMEWPELIELFITCGIFDVVNLLLRVQVPEDVAQSDASSILGDAWESVHLHSLELTSNILGSSYICPTEEKTRPFLNAVLSNKSFLDVVVKHAMESTRPMMISFALHILYHCATADVAAAKKIARKKELFLRLCEYVTKGNAVKMVTDWFRGGVEQYELDLLGDRPQGLLPIFHQEPFTQRAMDEMTKEEQRNAALTFADSLQLFSLRAMAMMCNVDTVGTDLVAKDPDLLTPCIRWLSAPVNSKNAGAAVKETLHIVSGLCSNEAICHRLVSSYNLIGLLEKGVYYSSFEFVKAYFVVATKIASHPGMLRSKIGAVESIARSAAIHMYCNSQDLQLFVFAYLTHIVETEGVYHMIKYFGPHHIHHYPMYYFNDVHDLDMAVTDLLRGYEHYAKGAYDQATAAFRHRLATSPKLNQQRAEVLKEEGNTFFRKQLYAKAIEKYTDAIVICPPLEKRKDKMFWYDLPVTLYSNRAQCHLMLENHAKAVMDCDKAAARCIDVCHAATIGPNRNNILLRKVLFRRAKALFTLRDYHRAICDISLCVRGEPTSDIFVPFKDKVMIRFRQKHGTEPVPSCDRCGKGTGKKLKRCSNCTALYCSRECQLDAWEKFHKVNCKEFMSSEPENGRKR
ncbi:uncharacterized protein, partial [Diadema antillarum]|uniref:uncharacterized protein n=1 Tax=Diadema antillarum TaxID=105358 RepID=UPI003A83DBC9